MAPHADDATIRVWVKYTCGLIGHTLQLRYPTGTPDFLIRDGVDGIIATMLPLMDPIDSVLGADKSDALSSIRFPFVVDVGPGTGASAANNPDARAAKISVTGKGAAGYLISFNMFFLNAQFFTQGRYAIGVVAAPVAAWWAQLTDSSDIAPCDINGDSFVLNAYVNAQENQYWVRKQR